MSRSPNILQVLSRLISREANENERLIRSLIIDAGEMRKEVDVWGRANRDAIARLTEFVVQEVEPKVSQVVKDLSQLRNEIMSLLELIKGVLEKLVSLFNENRELKAQLVSLTAANDALLTEKETLISEDLSEDEAFLAKITALESANAEAKAAIDAKAEEEAEIRSLIDAANAALTDGGETPVEPPAPIEPVEPVA